MALALHSKKELEETLTQAEFYICYIRIFESRTEAEASGFLFLFVIFSFVLPFVPFT